MHSVHSVHPPCPGRLSELSAWGSVLSALSALEDLSYIVSELGGGRGVALSASILEKRFSLSKN